MAKSDAKKSKRTESKSKGDAKPKGEKKRNKAASGMDALAKLAEHPLVSDLLAVGAMAAVAAIADQGAVKSGGGDPKVSRKAVKTAGKAAAAAIGQRLLREFSGIAPGKKA